MAEDFGTELNSLIVSTFHSILKVEERVLRESRSFDLSISEMHLIEAVGLLQQVKASISDVADYLKVTLPSVTVAVNKLHAKGYVDKIRDLDPGADGRRVYVRLTELGEAVNDYHERFHECMVGKIATAFTPPEQALLLRAVRKVDDFFTTLALDPAAYEL